MKEKTPPNAAFEEWISGAKIYIGYARYAQLGGHGFVAASCYDESKQLQDAIDDLTGGDNEAIAAAEIIEKMDCFYANHPDPAVAVQLLMGKMREFQRVIDAEQTTPKSDRNGTTWTLRQVYESKDSGSGGSV